MRKSLSVLLTLFLCGTSSAQRPTFRDLDYVGRGNPKQFLDLYIPPGLTQPAPLVIYIHGGGWQSGSKGGAMSFCDTLFARGYIVADINYRLSGDSIFPAQIYDCKAAVRWLKVHAAQYNIDTCRVAVTGSSAGGHLASLLGTSGGVDSLEDFRLGSRTATSRVHAVIPFYGPSDFLQMDAHVPRTPPDSCTSFMVHDDPTSPESRLLGCRISVCPDRVRNANPITYIDANDPPFALYHGTFDCAVPPYQSVLLDSALRAATVFSILSLVPYAPHAFRPNPQQKQEMLTFLNQYLTTCGTTNVDERFSSDATIRFALYQNYPNPFNPTTTIRFSLTPSLSQWERVSEGRVRVTLKVFDVLGREVAMLVNGELSAGEHSVQFNAERLPSGVYFYRLTAGTVVQQKKMVVIQ